ncbi:MAG: HAD-IA family hydrolase, partial [Candidatus Dependentiae bacterium]
FLHAADQLKAAPEECIVFEDSLAGFTAANAANISCVGIKNKKNAHFIDEHTHRHIEHYDDADEAVRTIITEVWQRS